MSYSIPIKSWDDLETFLTSAQDLIAYEANERLLTYQQLITLIDEKAKRSNKKNQLILLGLELKPKLEDIITILSYLKNKNQLVLFSNKEVNEELNEELLNKKKFSSPSAGIFFKTSGTSGNPKYYFFSEEKILTTAKFQANAQHLKTADKIGLNLPLFHVSGFMQVMRSLISLSTLYQKDDLLKKAQHISLVPTQIYKFLKNGELNKASGSQAILVGGSKLDETIKLNLENAGFIINESYGATETLGFFALNKKVLPHIEIIKSFDQAPILYAETLPDFYIQNQTLFETAHESKGIKLNDKVSIVKNEVNQVTEVEFIERLDTVFKIAGENTNPIFFEDKIKKNLHFHEMLDFLYLPYPDSTYQNIPILVSITQSELSAERKKEIEETLNLFFQNELKLSTLWLPKKIVFINNPNHFEQKIGRSFYIEHINFNFFLPNLNLDEIKLITFHGFLGNEEELDRLIPEETLAKKHRLHLTLPGELVNSPEYRDTINYFFHLKRLLKTIYSKTGSLNILAYSMGGRIMLRALSELMEENPTLLAHRSIKLILISASFGLRTDDEKILRKKNDQQLIEKFATKEEFLKFWYEQELFGPRSVMDKRLSIDQNFLTKINFNKTVLQKTLELFGPGDFPLFNQTLNAVLTNQQSFKAPIELIVGENDLNYYKQYRELSETHPKLFKLHLIPKAFHDPHRTNIAEITVVLKQLFK